MNEILCNDNRYELINKYKQRLVEATNIEAAQDEMVVLDNILFRFWQMGWLDKLERCECNSNENDLIHRQDVISLIRGMYPSEPVLPSNRRKWAEKYEQFIRAEREISKLPSAQPEDVIRITGHRKFVSEFDFDEEVRNEH